MTDRQTDISPTYAFSWYATYFGVTLKGISVLPQRFQEFLLQLKLNVSLEALKSFNYRFRIPKFRLELIKYIPESVLLRLNLMPNCFSGPMLAMLVKGKNDSTLQSDTISQNRSRVEPFGSTYFLNAMLLYDVMLIALHIMVGSFPECV